MKAVVLLSKTFFPQHYRAGELTGFAGKVKYTIWNEEQKETCKECKEKGYDIDCNTCTGAYRGEYKKHTCRKNYAYWKDIIDRLKEKGGVLSVRQWVGKAYQKPGQEAIVDIPADVVSIQKLELRRDKVMVEHRVEGESTPVATAWNYDYTAQVDGRPVPLLALAENDGLNLEEFKAWFAPVFDEAERKYNLLYQEVGTTIDFAVIHFTEERY